MLESRMPWEKREKVLFIILFLKICKKKINLVVAVPENTTYTFSKSNRLVRYGYIIDFSIATLRLNNRITGYYIRDMYIIDWLNSTLGNKIVFINIIFGLFWGSLRTPKRLFRGGHGSPFEKL